LRAQPVEGVRIGTITIDNRNIFDSANPAESHWIYRLANIIHFPTKKRVIQRELLFKTGDPYDPRLVEETARNLRKYPFLAKVVVETSPPENGVVNVKFITKDSWTTSPQLNFHRSGGQNTEEVGLQESNVLGYGKLMSAAYEKGGKDQFGRGNIHRTFTYADPQFLGKRFQFNGGVLQKSDGNHYGASISKPFYATIAPVSAKVSSFSNEDEIPVYVNSVEVGQFRRRHLESQISYGRSIHSSPSLVRQVVLFEKQETFDISPISDNVTSLIPQERDLTIFGVVGNWQIVDFIKERHINKVDRVEDFNMGPEATLEMGVGKNWRGNRSLAFFPNFDGKIGHSWSPGNFTTYESKYESSYLNHAFNNKIWSNIGQYFFRGLPQETLMLRARYDWGGNLDQDQLLFLGEENGLHGYKNNQFVGERRVLFNCEDRIFFVDDYLRLVSLGAVAFFDSGFVWPEGSPQSLGDLKSSVGLGFRFAFSRSSANIPIRFDLAYALNGNEQNSRWVLSVRSETMFGETVNENLLQ